MSKILYPVMLILLLRWEVFGFAVYAPVDLPIHHPVNNRSLRRSTGAWTSNVGTWGENIVTMRFERQGFQVVEIKNVSGNGLDRIAFRRGADGRLNDVRLIEVKTRYAASPARLGQTNHGTQLSRQWVARKFREMRNLGTPETKRLAREISSYSKRSGIPLVRMTELHAITQSGGAYRVYDPVSMRLMSETSLRNEFAQIKKSTNQRPIRKWAHREIRGMRRVSKTPMGTWVRQGNTSGPRLPIVWKAHVQSTSSSSGLRTNGVRGQQVVKYAGRAAIIFAIAADSNEVYRVYSAYDSGAISQRDFHLQLSRTTGGIGGAWAGAKGGAFVGFKLGLLGGPKAWVTAPAGAVVGGMAGGFGGYYSGSYLGKTSGTIYYEIIDEDLRDSVTTWILNNHEIPRQGDL